MSNTSNQMHDVKLEMQKFFFRASAKDFRKIPGCPIAYWVSSKVFDSFVTKRLLNDVATLKHGMSTSNNDRFLRQWHEVAEDNFMPDSKDAKEAEESRKMWFPFCKGGGFRRWYGNADYVVNWAYNGKEIKEETARKYPYLNGNIGLVIGAEPYYFAEAVTWSSISSSSASFRWLPSGFIICNKGQTLYSNGDLSSDLLLAFLNSSVASFILSVLSPTIGYELGYVRQIPVPDILNFSSEGVEWLISVTREDWNYYETSWEFMCPPLLSSPLEQMSLRLSYGRLRDQQRDMTVKAQRLEEENNRIFIEAYGLQDELTPDVPLKEITLTCNPHYRYGGDKTDEELEALLLADTMREFLSYAVGCMFGRYSLDKPGLVLANQGETLADYLRQVPEPRFMPDEDNVIPLLDGEWFPDDVTERFRTFLRVTFGDAHYVENLAFIENALGKDVRKYFLRDFYTDHVKRYKKRPIYWLFASPKGTFSALIYLHRYRPDTVSVVLQYLRDFRKKLAARLEHLQQVQVSTSASQGEKTKAVKEADTIRKQQLELDDYERDTLYPLATEQVELDLDDGVKVNYLKLGDALKKIPGLASKGED